MDVLDTRNKLICKEENRLQGEFAVAEVEQVLQAGAEQVEHHGIVVTLGAIPANEWDANATSKRLVNSSLVLELGVLGLDTLKFDGDLFARDDVCAKINVTEAAATNLTANAVFVADSKILKHTVSTTSFISIANHQYKYG